MIRLLISLLIPISLLAIIEYFVIDLLRDSGLWSTVWGYAYVVIAILGYVCGLLALYLKGRSSMRSPLTNVMIGVCFASFVQKLILILLILGYAIVRSVGGSALSYNTSLVLLLISFVPLVAMIYGAIWGKYRFQLEELDVAFEDLPDAFDGFKILHITDIHSGTWDSVKGVEKGIKLIEEQDADMIVFTGDLVNIDKDEIDPFIHLFERLDAPFGKYAILGNHDYYGQPRDRSLRETYYDDLYNKFVKMGFDLILNDSREIRKGNDVFQLVGVENWGSGRFFPKRGDLDVATKKIRKEDFTILLSHDPSHWDMKALQHPQHFHLTLSGHTHGMQFGINLPFFKWSPVQYRYKRWMGLYKEAGQYLYVNRGFGILGFPGRVGMSPEVALIHLRKAKSS